MDAVATTELLSRYLDNDLTLDEERQVENLLATDPEAQRLLDGLRQVVGELEGLPAVAPPVPLEARVQRALASRTLGRSRWLPLAERERAARGSRGTAFLVFALIVALAGVVFVYVGGLSRLRSSAPPTVESGVLEQITLHGRTFRRVADSWWEEGLHPEPGFPSEVLSMEASSQWFADHPELQPLRRWGTSAVVVDGSRVLTLRWAAEP